MQDIETIFPNLSPLGFGPHPHGEVVTQEPRHWYRCKALKDNGDCGIYATRPRMCSEYPYGDRCKYTSCTWDRARSDNPPTRQELIQIRRPTPPDNAVKAWDQKYSGLQD